jgi:HTH-type transcriptional regulator/antitoxin MqsA
MTITHRCDFCDADAVQEVSYEEAVPMGRKRPVINGLLKDVCGSCGTESISPTQAGHNHAIFQSALRSTPEALIPGLLRALRERWSLTQRQASELFGAGAGSFGKWEAGQLPSAPTARLVQCAAHVPGVMEYLADISKVQLPISDDESIIVMTRGSYLARRTHKDSANSCNPRRRLVAKLHVLRYDEPQLKQA